MESKVRLHEWLGAIRNELNDAATAYDDAGRPPPGFLLDEFVVEAQVAIERSTVTEGSLSFWIVKAGGIEGMKDMLTHKLSIRFKPLEDQVLGTRKKA